MSFLAQALRYPKFTGAIAPSSNEFAKLIAKKSKLKRSKFVVEVGPGTGVFTKEILRRKKTGTQYLGIEINGAFADKMKKEVPEATVVNDSAENISEILKGKGVDKCDRIISGLPWTAFEESLQNKLIEKFIEVLEDGGIFTTYSYYPLNHLPNGKSFRDKLVSNFSEVEISEVVCNIPPAYVYVCKK